MKRAYLIHGWGGGPNEHWFPWLARELERDGFEVFQPEMPDTDKPEIDAWVNALTEVIENPGEDVFLVGHSIGCQAIMRYLETREEKFGGAVFVAGWFFLQNLEEEEEKFLTREPWLTRPIDLAKVKQNLNGKLTVILSDNEPYGFVSENKNVFEDGLGAKVIIEHEKGHFTEEDGVVELPSALDEILNMAE